MGAVKKSMVSDHQKLERKKFTLRPTKENIQSSTSEHEISLLFPTFVGLFAPLDPDPDPETQINADSETLKKSSTQHR
jgi:hypothetical protein